MSQTTASSILIYGVSDSRKTTQIPEFARFVYEMTGRRTRMVSCETAGADRIQPAVDAGLIIPYWLRENPRSGIVHLARGDWPRPVQFDGRMVAKWSACLTSEWDEIGGYAIEGTASIAEMIVRQLIAEGRKVQEEVVSPYTEDDIKLGAAARSHFGVAQQDVLRLLAEAPRGLFDASRGKVQYILFTGHEAKGEDDQKSTIYGVGTTGKAAVKSIPKLVGTLLHHEIDKSGRKVWCYFRPHPDSENGNIMWDAKPNLPAHEKVYALLESDKRFNGEGKNGRFELRFDQSIYHYLKFQEECKAYVAEQTKQMLASMQQAKAAQTQKTDPPSAPIAEPPVVKQ